MTWRLARLDTLFACLQVCIALVASLQRVSRLGSNLWPQDQEECCGLFVPVLQSVLQAQCLEAAIRPLGCRRRSCLRPRSIRWLAFLFLILPRRAVAFGRPTSGHHLSSFSLRQCQVLVSEPRLLGVRIKAPALSWFFLVAYAPQSKRPAEEREAWWQRTTELTEALRQPGDVLFVCIDSNSHVGENPDFHWGPVGSESPSANIPLFGSFLDSLALCLPSTFSVHSGPDFTKGPVWISWRPLWLSRLQWCPPVPMWTLIICCPMVITMQRVSLCSFAVPVRVGREGRLGACMLMLMTGRLGGQRWLRLRWRPGLARLTLTSNSCQPRSARPLGFAPLGRRLLPEGSSLMLPRRCCRVFVCASIFVRF